MPYAILQKTLSPPSVDQLARAFRSLPDLTNSDARILAKDAFGILTSGLSHDQATILRQALAAEGVETEVVDEQDLFALPPLNRLRKADCLPSSLVIYDTLGRPTNLDWSHVILVAAGSVSLTESRRIERGRIAYQLSGLGGAIPYTVTDVSTKEERDFHLLLEIFLDVAPIRSRVDARQFRYDYLGPRLQTNSVRNFVLLVSDLAEHATRASLNRGAQSIYEDLAKTFRYPTRHAFEEESIWLLWKGGYQLKSQT